MGLARRLPLVHLGRMNRRGFLFRAGLVAAGAGGAWWLRDKVVWSRPEVAFGASASDWSGYARPTATTPTTMVRIGGREVTALIDSGAQYSVIDRGLFRDLGLTSVFDMPLVAYGVGGQPQVGRGVTLELETAGLRITGLRSAILDIGPLAGPQGLEAPLILGQDLLGRAVLEIDTEARRFRLVEPSAYAPPQDLRPVPVRRSRGALETDVIVEATTVRAVIDTGASALLGLGREAAEAAGLLDGRPSEASGSIVLGGAMRARIIEARSIAFADQVWRAQPVAVFDDHPLPGFPDALLGMQAFADQRVTLDLGGGRLWCSRPLDLTVGPPARRRA